MLELAQGPKSVRKKESHEEKFSDVDLNAYWLFGSPTNPYDPLYSLGHNPLNDNFTLKVTSSWPSQPSESNVKKGIRAVGEGLWNTGIHGLSSLAFFTDTLIQTGISLAYKAPLFLMGLAGDLERKARQMKPHLRMYPLGDDWSACEYGMASQQPSPLMWIAQTEAYLSMRQGVVDLFEAPWTTQVEVGTEVLASAFLGTKGFKPFIPKIVQKRFDRIFTPSIPYTPGIILPYEAGSVFNGFTVKDSFFWRVCSENNCGPFLMEAAPSSRLYARHAYSLPSQNTAKYIQQVFVPAGMELRRSRAKAAFGKKGGGVQFEVVHKEDLSKLGFSPGKKLSYFPSINQKNSLFFNDFFKEMSQVDKKPRLIKAFKRSRENPMQIDFVPFVQDAPVPGSSLSYQSWPTASYKTVQVSGNWGKLAFRDGKQIMATRNPELTTIKEKHSIHWDFHPVGSHIYVSHGNSKGALLTKLHSPGAKGTGELGKGHVYETESVNASPKMVVKLIKRDPRYIKGQAVTLLMCHGGGKDFAQCVANGLKAIVDAPKKPVWVTDSGRIEGYGKFKRYYPQGNQFVQKKKK